MVSRSFPSGNCQLLWSFASLDSANARLMSCPDPFYRSPDSPTSVSRVHPRTRDTRFDVRLIHASCLCLLIQKQNTVVTNTMHAMPVLHRHERDYRRIAVNEAQVEDYAEGVQLLANILQAGRVGPHHSLRRAAKSMTSSEATGGIRWFRGPGRCPSALRRTPLRRIVPRGVRVVADLACGKPARATGLPRGREERCGRRAAALKEVFVCLQHERGELPADGCSRWPLLGVWRWARRRVLRKSSP